MANGCTGHKALMPDVPLGLMAILMILTVQLSLPTHAVVSAAARSYPQPALRELAFITNLSFAYNSDLDFTEMVSAGILTAGTQQVLRSQSKRQRATERARESWLARQRQRQRQRQSAGCEQMTCSGRACCGTALRSSRRRRASSDGEEPAGCTEGRGRGASCSSTDGPSSWTHTDIWHSSRFRL